MENGVENSGGDGKKVVEKKVAEQPLNHWTKADLHVDVTHITVTYMYRTCDWFPNGWDQPPPEGNCAIQYS